MKNLVAVHTMNNIKIPLTHLNVIHLTFIYSDPLLSPSWHTHQLQPI